MRHKELQANAAVISMGDGERESALGELVTFRRGFYECLTGRADALFELCEAVLCADGPVRPAGRFVSGAATRPRPRRFV
ncbi:hypothetical protein GCM10027262_75610 [Nocardia tengchongensis]